MLPAGPLERSPRTRSLWQSPRYAESECNDEKDRTIIGVSDVWSSVAWCQTLFGQPATVPAHDDFGQILDSDGPVLLCLHK